MTAATRRTAISAIALASRRALGAASSAAPAASRLENRTLATGLVPSPAKYAALTPPGVATAAGLPLLLLLHGGDGDNGFLEGMKYPRWRPPGPPARSRPALVVTRRRRPPRSTSTIATARRSGRASSWAS